MFPTADKPMLSTKPASKCSHGWRAMNLALRPKRDLTTDMVPVCSFSVFTLSLVSSIVCSLVGQARIMINSCTLSLALALARALAVARALSLSLSSSLLCLCTTLLSVCSLVRCPIVVLLWICGLASLPWLVVVLFFACTTLYYGLGGSVFVGWFVQRTLWSGQLTRSTVLAVFPSHNEHNTPPVCIDGQEDVK